MNTLLMNVRAVRRVAVTLLGVAALCVLSGCGGSGGDGDDGPGGGTNNVFLLTAKSALTSVTGEDTFRAFRLGQLVDGQVIIFDDISRSLVKIGLAGIPSSFVSKAAFLAQTGGDEVQLGPLVSIIEGALRGYVLVADSETGNLLRIDSLGSVVLFTTKQQVINVTGELDASLRLPQELTNNQYVAQDLVTRNVLRFGGEGFPTPFVSGLSLGTAANVPSILASVSGWARGRATRSLFARFSSTNNIVRISTAGEPKLYVSGASLEGLFPDIADLRVIDMVSDLSSDALLILVGESTTGIGLALMSGDGLSLTVFTSPASLKAVAGDGVHLTSLAVLATGAAVAVDNGGGQVLAFQGGVPIVIASRDEIETATGTLDPEIFQSVGLGPATSFEGILVPDNASESLILVK